MGEVPLYVPYERGLLVEPRGVAEGTAFRFLPIAAVLWFRGGLVFKAHRLCVSLNSRLESNNEEEVLWFAFRGQGLVVLGFRV